MRAEQLRALVRSVPDFPAPGVLFRSMQYNFGLIEIDATPRLTFRAVGADGTTFYTESFTPDDLTPAG